VSDQASCSPIRRPRSGGPRPGPRGLVVTLLALATLAPAAPPARAGEPALGGATPVQSLDEQVQAIKSDVLAISAELGNLEEKLLFPADTQLAVFVEQTKGEPLEVDSARLTVDGQVVAQHVYAWKELQALAKGGVQRLHTGNVATGSHRLEVTIAGRRHGDEPYEVVKGFDFSKAVGPKRIGIRLAHGAGADATVAIEDW
jgi:hypothetical protein